MTAGTVPSLLATRIRKARRPSACGLCGRPVSIGQRIGLVENRWWAHVTCIIARNARAKEDP